MDDVYELINLGKGDLNRLYHIKDTLENNRTLYASDRKYVEELATKYLETKNGTEPEHRESSYKPKFCGKCGTSLPDNVNFCVGCGYPTDQSVSYKQEFGNKNNESKDSTKNEFHTSMKKPKKIGTLKAIGIGIATLFLVMIIGGALISSNPNFDKYQGLTANQKSIIQSMEDNCSYNMAYLQSDYAGKLVEEKCMKSVDKNILKFKQQNEQNNSP